ncbi:MAG: ABC transporter ATP-binding protein/permease [Lachnospiraceae bacterium]|nr:ABC transporter ATP-binding protein/permease [Lachnospiraceae bacterium]
MEEKKESQKEKKLSLREVLNNAFYALGLGIGFSKKIFFNIIFVAILGYFQWVFFSSVFMKNIVGSLDRGDDYRKILAYIGICGLSVGLMNLYQHYFENVTLPVELTRLYGKLYHMLFDKARNVELSCYENSDFYNRYTMAMDGADQKISDIMRRFWGIIFGSIATGFVFSLMFSIDRFAVIFIICPLIGNFVFGSIKNRFELARYKEQVSGNKVMNYVSRAMYLPDYAKEMRLFDIYNLLKKQYTDATDRNVDIASKYAFKNAFVNFWKITFTFSVIFEGVLFYAIYRNLVTQSISLADLTIMTSMMVSMTWILIGLFDDIVNFMKDGVFISNLRGFLDYKEKIPEDHDGYLPGSFESIEFDNVSFSYTDEETIRNLSFTIRNGEIAALVGHNGAGKTTIIKLLLRLYDPTEGVIRLNGRDIREYNLHAYREIFATTFQDFAIMGMPIRDNVLMGRHYEGEDKIVEDALRKSGVYDRVVRLEKGTRTVMTKEFDENGAVFSGGESQKLAVSRTFAKPAPVKIFDEPSSALDPIAEYELFNNIAKEGSDHTLLFISHRLSSVKHCDKVFMLEKGRIIEEGSHEELMSLGGKYAKMYRRQANNYLAIEDGEEVAE